MTAEPNRSHHAENVPMLPPDQHRPMPRLARQRRTTQYCGDVPIHRLAVELLESDIQRPAARVLKTSLPLEEATSSATCCVGRQARAPVRTVGCTAQCGTAPAGQCCPLTLGETAFPVTEKSGWRRRDRGRRNPAAQAPSSDTCSAFVRSILVATPTSLSRADLEHVGALVLVMQPPRGGRASQAAQREMLSAPDR